MLIVDLIVGGLIALMVGWGFSRGLTVTTLAMAGFAAGAVLGSRLAPLLLNGGLHSTYAPEVALPGALLLGALAAAVVERFGLRLRHRLDRLGPANPVGGALLGACLGLVAAWMLGTVVMQVSSLGDQVRRSAILSRLDALLPPPGPAPVSEVASSDPFPTLEGPGPPVAALDPQVTREPGVRAATRSVVKISVLYCNHGKGGTGWIAADGIVATNAHVVAAEDVTSVRFRDRGPPYPATPIWFDPKNDIALLRVPGVKGVPALSLAGDPRAGSSAAMIGFPGGNWAVRPTRLGVTSRYIEGFLGGHPLPREFSNKLFGRPITPFSGRAEPGNSGSPLVDGRGRVLTTAFGGGHYNGLGVPNAFVRSALRRAGPPVGTGPC